MISRWHEGTDAQKELDVRPADGFHGNCQKMVQVSPLVYSKGEAGFLFSRPFN